MTCTSSIVTLTPFSFELSTFTVINLYFKSLIWFLYLINTGSIPCSSVKLKADIETAPGWPCGYLCMKSRSVVLWRGYKLSKDVGHSFGFINSNILASSSTQKAWDTTNRHTRLVSFSLSSTSFWFITSIIFKPRCCACKWLSGYVSKISCLYSTRPSLKVDGSRKFMFLGKYSSVW